MGIKKGEMLYSTNLKKNVLATEDEKTGNLFIKCEFELSGRKLKNMLLPVNSLVRKCSDGL